MRSLAILLLVSGLTFGQPPAKKDTAPKESSKPASGSLEDTLEKALRNSADIKAAEAKVREAEAQLNQVRQQVLTKATALHNDLNQARRMLPVLESALKEQIHQYETKLATQNTVIAAEAAVEKQKGEIEKLEAELKSLRGEFAVKGIRDLAFSPDAPAMHLSIMDGAVRIWELQSGALIKGLDVNSSAGMVGSVLRPAPSAGLKTSMAERVRKLLDTEVADPSDVEGLEANLTNVLNQAKSDVPYRILVQPAQASSVRLPKGGKLPVGAYLQAIEDSVPDLRIVVREYGLLLTTRDRVPEGSVRVVDFWKAKDAKPTEKK